MTISVRWATLLIRLALAITATIAFIELGGAIKEDRLVIIAQVLGNLAGTLLGFTITSIALVAAVMNRDLIQNMRKTGHFQRLTREAFATSILLLSTTIVSIGSLFADGGFLRSALAAGVFLGVLAVLYAIEMARRFATIVEHL